MNNKLAIAMMCVFSCTPTVRAQIAKQALLHDGTALSGAAGKFLGPDGNDVCFFELSSPIDSDGLTVEPGTKFELLPSSALEMMISDVKTHPSAMYQLWNARVTEYKGRNYIFPSIFIRINPPSAAQHSEGPGKGEPAEIRAAETPEPNSAGVDVNDSLSLPPEVIERMNAAGNEMNKAGQRIVDSNIVTIDTVQQELERKRQANPDTVLLDKYAVLAKRDAGELDFHLDSLGRNVNRTSFRLLPCEVLEQTEKIQASSPEPLRFEISGTVTKYKGSDYLLLYKAMQVYSQGNFPD